MPLAVPAHGGGKYEWYLRLHGTSYRLLVLLNIWGRSHPSGMTAIDMIAHHEFVHVISLSRCAASGKTLWSGGRCLPYHTACFVKRHTGTGRRVRYGHRQARARV